MNNLEEPGESGSGVTSAATTATPAVFSATAVSDEEGPFPAANKDSLYLWHV